MNIEYFQIFIEVYRSESFAEVARSRNMAPSSVTRIVALLEEELGVRLFYRTTRRVTPSEEGHKLYVRITDWLAEFDTIRSEVGGDRNEPEGTLRLTTSVTFNQIILVDLLARFRRKYPKINLDVLVTDRAVDLVADRIDVAIRFGKLSDSEYRRLKLFDLSYALVASPRYLASHGRPGSLAEISQHDCLSLLLSQYHAFWKFRVNGREEVVKVAPVLRATGAISLIEWAKRAMGVTLLPRQLIAKELKREVLVPLLPNYEATPTEFGSAAWLLFPPEQRLPQKTRHFINFMKEADLTKLLAL